MVRPLRLQFACASHHVTARDDGREPILVDDEDRCTFVDVTWRTRVNAALSANSSMGNRYHLALTNQNADLLALAPRNMGCLLCG